MFIHSMSSTITYEFPGGSVIKKKKKSPVSTGDVGLIPELEDLLEKEMATYSHILAWKIPWTG